MEPVMQVRHAAMTVAFALTLSPLANAQDAAPAAPEAAPAAEEAKPAEAAPAEEEAKPADAAPPAEAAPVEPAPAPAPTHGSLSVSSDPAGASIFIDDKDSGQKTPTVDMKVEPGTHTLRVSMDGREKTVTFHLEAGGQLNLNLNLPEATPVKKPEPKPEPMAKAEPTDSDPKVEEKVEAPWTWMTVTGWAGLGLGTIGLIAGAVVLTTPYDPDQGPLGFGLFGTGAGLMLGGGVLLYLDNELNAPEPAAEPEVALAVDHFLKSGELVRVRIADGE
jgi:hypothetical protein